MAPSGAEPPTNQRSDRSTAASGWLERVSQVRTRRTAPPDRPAADPSSIQVSTTGRMNQRFLPASTGCFSTQSAESRHKLRPTHLVLCGPRAACSSWSILICYQSIWLLRHLAQFLCRQKLTLSEVVEDFKLKLSSSKLQRRCTEAANTSLRTQMTLTRSSGSRPRPMEVPAR